MYDEQREDQGNNLLGNVVIGAGLLGAGALGLNYARSVAKNRTRKAQVNVSDNMPRSGQGGVQRMDLSALPEQTKAGVYKRAAESYPDPGVGKDDQYRNPGSGGTDLSMLITDPNTGEVYRRGGGQSVNQRRASTQGGINLAKQNLGTNSGQDSVQNGFLAAMRQSNNRLGEENAFGSMSQGDYVRNRIASSLEAAPQSVGPNIQMRDLPPADRVSQLIAEVGVDKRGAMTAGREVANEAAQMTATEASRQSAAVRRMEKQDPEFERIAKDILSEMRDKGSGGGGGVAKQPKPSGGGGMSDEKAARIERNRQKDMARINDYMSDVLESSISETQFTNEQIPSSVLKLAERAGTGTANAQDVSSFRNWAQTQFKNDPTVLGEINEAVGSFFEQQPTKTTPTSSGPKLAGYSEGPVDAQDQQHIQASRRDMPETLVEVREASAPFARDASNEAVQTANDQRDLQIIKHIQRNEDVDLTRFNEDILDKRVAEARSYLQRQEIDLDYDYSKEVARQAADVGAALERIRNNPKRVAAEGIISELQAEGRAERDLARFQAEGPEGGELAGLKAEDNIRQRSEQQGSRSMTGEQLEEVLLGESKVVDSNMRGRALRGGKVNEEGNYFTDAGTVTYVGEGGAETGDFRNASTGIRTDIPAVASVAKTPEGAASILASEAIRKKYQDQRPEPLRGPAADVARSMQTLREGMSVEPSEVLPSTQVPTIYKGGYADGEAVIAVPTETAFTGDAADAAGPVFFTGKSKRDSAVVGTSPPLIQETVVANPQAAAANEGMAQSFLEKAIGGGLTQKATPTVEVYETPRLVGPAQLAGPGSVPLSRSAVADPELGPDPSQRTGYARFVIGEEGKASKPVGTPSTGAMTVGINYAALPSVIDPNRDIGRAPYRGPVQTYAERLAQSTGGTATPMSMLPDRGDGRTTRSIQPPAYDPRYKTAGARVEKYPAPEAPTRTVYRDPNTGATFVPVEEPKAFELRGPAPIAADAGPVRLSVPADPNRQYAPQVAAGKQAVVTYPHMRGESLFSTGTLMNDPNLRGGPVKFEGRERGENEYVRPISERLGRGDTMQRFPIIRRG